MGNRNIQNINIIGSRACSDGERRRYAHTFAMDNCSLMQEKMEGIAPKKRPFFRSRFCRRCDCRIGRSYLRHREGISSGRRVENGLFGSRVNPLLCIDERAGGTCNRAETY